jgi:hypothetical protein
MTNVQRRQSRGRFQRDGIVDSMSALKITLNKNLPSRARALGAGAMSQVFGGCAQSGQPCQSTADCCPARSDHTVLTCRLDQISRHYTCRYGS